MFLTGDLLKICDTDGVGDLYRQKTRIKFNRFLQKDADIAKASFR